MQSELSSNDAIHGCNRRQFITTALPARGSSPPQTGMAAAAEGRRAAAKGQATDIVTSGLHRHQGHPARPGHRLERRGPVLGPHPPGREGLHGAGSPQPRPGHRFHRHGRPLRRASLRRHGPQGRAAGQVHPVEQDLAAEGVLELALRRGQGGSGPLPQGAQHRRARHLPDSLHDGRPVADRRSSAFAMSCPSSSKRASFGRSGSPATTSAP